MEVFKRPIYRMHIDEMGNHHFPTDKNDELNRFLCLTGIIFKLGDDYNTAAMSKLSLENKYWPTRNPDYPIILHREEIVHKRGYFVVLKDPSTEKAFNTDLLNLLSSMKAIIITVVLDKFKHRLKYRDYAYEPYGWCLNILMQKYTVFLKRINSIGDIIIESRGKKEDQVTKKIHTDIYQNGCIHYKADRYQQCLSSKEIKLSIKKDNVFGLQVADITGAAIQRKMLYEKGYKNSFPGTFNEQMYKAIEHKILHSFTGELNLWGETFLP